VATQSSCQRRLELPRFARRCWACGKSLVLVIPPKRRHSALDYLSPINYDHPSMNSKIAMCFDLGFETATVEQFTFERGKETLAHGIIEAIADRAHRRSYAGFAAALAEGDRSVLGEFKRSSQHLERRNCDDYSKAPFGLVRASTVAVAGPAGLRQHDGRTIRGFLPNPAKRCIPA
jgi:hypothetical protein